jgi:hypothetical protein
LTAKRFLDSEPYGDGSEVTEVVVLPVAGSAPGERVISFGCGSRGGTSGSPRDRPVGVASLVDPLAFLVEMERPVVVEVSVAA